MKNVLFALALVTLVSFGEPGAWGQKRSKPAPRRAVSVYMGLPNWLHIFSDGSGIVGYGAGGGNGDSIFKAGTFDVEQVIKQLKALPSDKKRDLRTRFSYSLESERKGPDEPVPAYYTRERKLILSLFRRAYDAGSNSSARGKKLKELVPQENAP